MKLNSWRSLECLKSELNLNLLGYGQSFRWRKINDEKSVWEGIAGHRIWRLQQDEEKLHFKCLGRFSRADCSSKDDAEILSDYFHLDTVKLIDLNEKWSKNDQHFSAVSQKRPGLRILRMDPFECLISFICSSNNNIKRISKMVEAFCKFYGEKLLANCPETSKELIFYDFPSIHALQKAISTDEMVAQLRLASFGYRSDYIVGTVLRLVEISADATSVEDHLLALRQKSYDECVEFLRKLPGVGPKVADCVCLMSLEKSDVVPLDTHLLQLTARHYLTRLKNARGLNLKIRREIREFYLDKFGPFAGWAQATLFANELNDV